MDAIVADVSWACPRSVDRLRRPRPHSRRVRERCRNL